MRNYFLTASRWEAGSSETYQKGYGTRQKNPESAFCIGKCFAVWCPDPSSATEAASCNGNGAAWPKDTPNTGLPVPLFLEFLWEAQSRFWKKNPTHPVLHFSLSQCYSPTRPILAWLSASLWQQQDEFPSHTIGIWNVPSPERNCPTRPGVPPLHTEGMMVLRSWQPLLQKEFCRCKSLQKDLKSMLMGKKPQW